MDRIMKGWFSEICPMWPGRALSIEIESLLFEKQSKFQKIEVYETKNCGRMLVLDGIIQLAEVDEFAYQEMMAHIPLCAHPAPENLLVVGGGDGGILREAVRHQSLRKIDICEIDADVIEVSEKYLPFTACGYKDPRVAVHIADGNEFVKDAGSNYDVIIVDSSDPIGPGEILFRKEFYAAMKNALRPGGVIATQAEAVFLHRDIVQSLMKIADSLFPSCGYANIIVPTYPGGHIGACVASLGPVVTRPARKLPDEVQEQLLYYNPRIHEASFVLPNFAKSLFDGAE